MFSDDDLGWKMSICNATKGLVLQVEKGVVIVFFHRQDKTGDGVKYFMSHQNCVSS